MLGAYQCTLTPYVIDPRPHAGEKIIKAGPRVPIISAIACPLHLTGRFSGCLVKGSPDMRRTGVSITGPESCGSFDAIKEPDTRLSTLTPPGDERARRVSRRRRFVGRHAHTAVMDQGQYANVPENIRATTRLTSAAFCRWRRVGSRSSNRQPQTIVLLSSPWLCAVAAFGLFAGATGMVRALIYSYRQKGGHATAGAGARVVGGKCS